MCALGHPPHAQTARPEVKLLKHPLRPLVSLLKNFPGRSDSHYPDEYKAADIASKLTKQDRSVHVVMTAGATQFVTPLTLQTLSRHPVTTNILRTKR